MTEAEAILSLRKAIPVEGEDWTYLWRLCVMPGSMVDPHTHHGWTAVCHVPPSEGEPPIELLVDGEVLYPDPWEVIVIPPNVEHAVNTNLGKLARLSFALTMIPGDNRQVLKNVTR